MERELVGETTLSFSHMMAGIYCIEMLAQYGAEIIHVELMNEEFSKDAPPTSENFLSGRRNQQTLLVDMDEQEDKEFVYGLVEKADLFITTFSLVTQQNLGIDYETISRRNQRICYIHITGYGLTDDHDGENILDKERENIKYEHLLNEDLQLLQYVAGKQGVIGALLALRLREKSGRGCYVDTGNLKSMLSAFDDNLDE